jgi:hypothetical protein
MELNYLILQPLDVIFCDDSIMHNDNTLSIYPQLHYSCLLTHSVSHNTRDLFDDNVKSFTLTGPLKHRRCTGITSFHVPILQGGIHPVGTGS